jgi:hypothetical protein
VNSKVGVCGIGGVAVTAMPAVYVKFHFLSAATARLQHEWQYETAFTNGGSQANAYGGGVYIAYHADASGEVTSFVTCIVGGNELKATAAGGGYAQARGGGVFVEYYADANGATTSFFEFEHIYLPITL